MSMEFCLINQSILTLHATYRSREPNVSVEVRCQFGLCADVAWLPSILLDELGISVVPSYEHIVTTNPRHGSIVIV